MQKKLLMLAAFLLLLLISACQAAEDENVFEPVYLDVEITIDPEKGETGEKIIFEALVTYGGEPVEDAYEVSFEIWRAHDEEHENIVVPHAESGIYRLEKEFSEEGTYYVIAHVTAKDMHYMPRKEFVIGKESEPEENPSSSIMTDEFPEAAP